MVPYCGSVLLVFIVCGSLLWLLTAVSCCRSSFSFFIVVPHLGCILGFLIGIPYWGSLLGFLFGAPHIALFNMLWFLVMWFTKECTQPNKERGWTPPGRMCSLIGGGGQS